MSGYQIGRLEEGLDPEHILQHTKPKNPIRCVVLSTRCDTSFSQYHWYFFRIIVPSDKAHTDQGVYAHVVFIVIASTERKYIVVC